MIKNNHTINGIAKKCTLVVILASAVTLGASTPIKNTRQEKEPQQTELMSQKAAEALKVNSFQQNPTVPTVHNKKLDEMFIRFAESKEDTNMVNNFINSIYSNTGTYFASFRMQQEIDNQCIFAFLEGNFDILKRFPNVSYKFTSPDIPDMKEIYENKDAIIKWMDETYTPSLMSYLSFDHKPTADELNKRLHDYAYNNLSDDNYILYSYFMRNKADVLVKGKSDIQSKSDYIAYNIHILNFVLYSQILKKMGGNSTAQNYYEMWVNAVSPRFDK